MADEGNLHQRSTSDPAFYEWLLSDHPAARAERDYRRAASCQYQRDQAAAVLTWVAKINAQADAPQTLRDLADSLEPSARESARRAEIDYAEPDDLYAARCRAELETHMQVSGPPDAYDYRYPGHLTGPSAADDPPPPAPQADGPEIGG